MSSSKVKKYKNNSIIRCIFFIIFVFKYEAIHHWDLTSYEVTVLFQHINLAYINFVR